MLKIIALISLLHWSALVPPSTGPGAEVSCPGISSLQEASQGSNSIAYSWSPGAYNPQYRVWYIRQEDSSFSGYFYTYNNAYEFSGLSAGHYTFYFQVVCGSEISSWIGIEDVISG